MESFNVGDVVLLDVYDKEATIEKVNGQPAHDSGMLFTVLTEDGEQKIISSTFFLKKIRTRKKSPVDKSTPNESEQKDSKTIKIGSLHIDKIAMQQSIDQEIENIIEKLGLEKTSDFITQLKNCTKVQEYIIKNFTFTEEIMSEKEAIATEDFILAELYNALILKRSVCTSNSIAFKEILSRVGMTVKTIGVTTKASGVPHFSNLVLLEGEYYFFDTTLDQTVFNSQDVTDEVILCCAGLGLETYEKYYEPKVELESPEIDPLPLPKNIAKQDIPNEVVNASIFNKMIL